ncbi:uncharacterized protein BDR25DRAFT_353446 [Lindgomyces ingoldianus]|uniref:Uncharacterized protein n=1 Tax=Lindgomyces ingoldianus TaxID=673940 RepID=A0ACB6R1U5_9PLEO|nr:uncharacterized protein BDR25DRAFT_353446 [Lindgomyces ingoldianus]KAF2472416.1 hypothetical protein BDR25DRAFT_353446 [Lindgomyces ingoldianus]
MLLSVSMADLNGRTRVALGGWAVKRCSIGFSVQGSIMKEPLSGAASFTDTGVLKWKSKERLEYFENCDSLCVPVAKSVVLGETISMKHGAEVLARSVAKFPSCGEPPAKSRNAIRTTITCLPSVFTANSKAGDHENTMRVASLILARPLTDLSLTMQFPNPLRLPVPHRVYSALGKKKNNTDVNLNLLVGLRCHPEFYDIGALATPLNFLSKNQTGTNITQRRMATNHLFYCILNPNKELYFMSLTPFRGNLSSNRFRFILIPPRFPLQTSQNSQINDSHTPWGYAEQPTSNRTQKAEQCLATYVKQEEQRFSRYAGAAKSKTCHDNIHGSGYMQKNAPQTEYVASGKISTFYQAEHKDIYGRMKMQASQSRYAKQQFLNLRGRNTLGNAALDMQVRGGSRSIILIEIDNKEQAKCNRRAASFGADLTKPSRLTYLLFVDFPRTGEECFLANVVKNTEKGSTAFNQEILRTCVNTIFSGTLELDPS